MIASAFVKENNRMVDPKQLPHLIKLLGDESEIIQSAIQKELLSFGDSLKPLLKEQRLELSEKQTALLEKLLREHDRTWLRQSWSGCFSEENEKQQLESALSLLAQFQCGRKGSRKLSPLLDKIAEEFQALNITLDPFRLAVFLFQEKGLKGARADYNRPDNSNLVYVIEQKRGIPISLACIYILVGKRLELDIEGCNFPGHFLARAKTDTETLLVDCYDGGRLLSNEIIVNSEEIEGQAILRSSDLLANSRQIISRVLRNLIEAFDQADQAADSKLMIELLRATVSQG
jgi:regulator of sirC expression with transglutaminase-like and TPR domain